MDDEALALDRAGGGADGGAGVELLTEVPQTTRLGEVPVFDEPRADRALEGDGPAPCTDVLALPREPDLRSDDAAVERIIEALLFASDSPLSTSRIGELVGGCSPVQVRLHIASLNDKYVAGGHSFRIEAIARGYQMMTLARFRPWLTRLNQQRAQTRLSAAALEALSIIAYKQPIIRADIEAIRGVACGEVLGRLREMGLIRIVGRAEVIGRPLLYGTTKRFLDVFGLAELDDLPPLEALTLRRSSSGLVAADVQTVSPPPLAVSA